MNILFEYIKYKVKAKNRHGIHSPYVYAISDCALTQSIPYELKNLRKELLNKLDSCHEHIQITDYGVGSKHLGIKRSIRSMAKTSASRGAYGWFLYRLAKHIEPKNILELGTSLGIGSWHLMHGYPSGSLITVEGCPETARFATKTLKDIPGVQVVNQRFIDFIPTLNPTYRADLVFIDGHHDGEALLGYIDQLLPHSHDETIFIVDDIRWSDCMYKAWQQLKGDHRFHVSIDFFRMGLLVKRPYQEKETFTLSL